MEGSALDTALESSDEEGLRPAAKNSLFDFGLFRKSDDLEGYRKSQQHEKAAVRKSIAEGQERAAAKAEEKKKGNSSRQKRHRDSVKASAISRGEEPKQRGRPRGEPAAAAAESDAEGTDSEQVDETGRRTVKVCYSVMLAQLA